MGILDTLKRVFITSEDIDISTNSELSNELKNSLKNIEKITALEEARQRSAVNFSGKTSKSVKETSKVKFSEKAQKQINPKISELVKDIDEDLEH